MPTYDTVAQPPIVYPESDGQPIADNTLQFRWIVTIQGGIDALFKDDPDVFVAGDLLWYPVEGHPEIRVAPDILVAFGRPKGERGSYLQWREGNIPPQVVFEILSPGNRITEMTRKFWFYDKYGADEYYIYDPDTAELSGWRREEGELVEITPIEGWVSPRLGIQFALEGGDLTLYRPDGRRFATYIELEREAEVARQQAERERAQQQIEQERRERELAQQQAQHERGRAERLAAQLRALGVEPDQG
jgi:Uma2 family endonuclease